MHAAGDVVDYVSNQRIGAEVYACTTFVTASPRQTQVTLGELPDEDRGRTPSCRGKGKIGLALQTLSPDVAASLGIDRATRGAVITDVVTGAPPSMLVFNLAT